MEYIEGVLKFVEFASKHASDGKIFYPCTKCVNMNLVLPGVAREHLWSKGMLQNRSKSTRLNSSHDVISRMPSSA